MRLGVAYDVGNGRETVDVSPRAMIGWELKSGRRISDLAEGFGIDDMTEILWQQLRISPACPYGARAALVNDLVDIDVIVPETPSDPTEPDQ